MAEDITRIKSGITVSVGVSVKILKNKVHVKKIIFGILLNVVVKMANIWQVIMCNEIIQETKTDTTNFNEKR